MLFFFKNQTGIRKYIFMNKTIFYNSMSLLSINQISIHSCEDYISVGLQ